MSEKDIKMKPKDSPKGAAAKNTPKVVVKSKDAVVNTVKDAGSVAKDAMIRKAIETKLGSESGEQQPQKADTEAAESVESAAYTTADTAYHKGKTFTQNRIREYRANKVKTREQAENDTPDTPEETPDNPEASKEPDNQPKTRDSQEPTADKGSEQKSSGVKTKEEYLKSQGEKQSKADGVKTKENYLKEHNGDNMRSGVKEHKPSTTPKTKDSIHYADGRTEPKTAQDARREYVESKLKRKGKADIEEVQSGNSPKTGETDNAPKSNDVRGEKAPKTSGHRDEKAPTTEAPREKSQIKTKESYMRSLQQERVEPRQTISRQPKEKTVNVRRSTANVKKGLKTRENVVGKSKSVIKSGNSHTAKKTTRNAVKTANKAAKTQKEVAKKAAKQAAIKAKQAAIKAAQLAKAAAIKTAKAAVAIGKAIVAAVTKAAAAFFAAFGWIGVVVLLVILIVVIIVAAIAASPFGIFISDEAADANSIPVSSIVNECNIELSQKLTDIEDNTAHDRIVMEGEQADWSLVLSLFSVKVAGTGDDTAQDVVVIDDAKKQKLKEVFWDMHTITSRTETVTSGETSETVLYITITAKTKDQMISQYGFNAKQKEALETLLENSDAYVGSMQSLAISDATAQDVIDTLPDSLSAERKSVVKKACSLVGKVTYFWGGKSSAIGWDSEWGKMKLVTSEGSRTTGCMRPFGLDCSGFVTWAFHNAGFSESAIGHGASTQASKGTRISWSSAQPGDLAVYDDKSHIGIVAGKDSSGNTLVIHCSSGANNVVITTGGFGFVVRPNCYS